MLVFGIVRGLKAGCFCRVLEGILDQFILKFKKHIYLCKNFLFC